MAAKMDERSAGSRGWTLTDMPHPEDFGDRVLVTVLSTEDLTAEQRCSIAEVCIAAHNNAAFANLFNYIKSGGRHFLAYRRRELASHAVVTTRWVQPEGLTVLKTAFVDAVSTLPAYQGLGYASAVMRRLAAEIDDYTIGCLQTDLPAFYERLGWEVWRGSLAGRSEHGLIPTPQQRGVMVLRLPQTPPLDLERQLTIECQSDRIWE
jgi:aminoglycoside 2'-N-acetyltransferase I